MIDPVLHEDHAASTTDRMLRQFAVVWIVFFGGLALLEAYGRGRSITGYILGAVAVTGGVLGLAAPRALRPLFVVLTAITYPIGWVVSKILLLAMFYGVFTPFALVFKLMGRDALARRPVSSKETYWLRKPSAHDIRSYFRQS